MLEHKRPRSVLVHELFQFILITSVLICTSIWSVDFNCQKKFVGEQIWFAPINLCPQIEKNNPEYLSKQKSWTATVWRFSTIQETVQEFQKIRKVRIRSMSSDSLTKICGQKKPKWRASQDEEIFRLFDNISNKTSKRVRSAPGELQIKYLLTTWKRWKLSLSSLFCARPQRSANRTTNKTAKNASRTIKIAISRI